MSPILNLTSSVGTPYGCTITREIGNLKQVPVIWQEFRGSSLFKGKIRCRVVSVITNPRNYA
jgi:hypothetical protein